MKVAAFNAICPVEIGDKVTTIDGSSMAAGHIQNGQLFAFPGRPVTHTITDIACIHYVARGDVKFMYELDNSGKYVSIQFPENLRTQYQQEPVK